MWCEAIDVKFGQRGKANARSAYQNQFAKQIAMQGVS
jgi:hypothetical protein